MDNVYPEPRSRTDTFWKFPLPNILFPKESREIKWCLGWDIPLTGLPLSNEHNWIPAFEKMVD